MGEILVSPFRKTANLLRSSASSASSSAPSAGRNGSPRPIWLPATLLVLFSLTLLTLHTDAPGEVLDLSASLAQSAQNRYDALRSKLGQQQQQPIQSDTFGHPTPAQLQAIEQLEPKWRWAANASIVYTVGSSQLHAVRRKR